MTNNITVHTATTLSAKEDTLLKQSPVADSGMLLPQHKYFLGEGQSLAITSVEVDNKDDSFNGHYKVVLASPINSFTEWFAYIPHVKIIPSLS